MRIRLGTRGSRLALVQAGSIVQALEREGLSVDVVTIKTTGDRKVDWDRSEKGIFVAEIDQALQQEEIDLAVHSLKDIPTELPAGLAVVCVPLRATPFDAVLPVGALKSLEKGARVGTSSIRRNAEILRARPDLEVVEMRGNVDTRLERLARGEVDGVMLAEAGLERLEVDRRTYERLPAEVVVPPAGQGALAVVARDGAGAGPADPVLLALSRIEDQGTRVEVGAERAFVHGMGAGCHSPVGALARLSPDGTLSLYAAIGGTEKRVHLEVKSNRVEAGEALGRDAAMALGSGHEVAKEGGG